MRNGFYEALYVVGYGQPSSLLEGFIHIADVVAAVEVDITAADSKYISL